ncbi:hypothetical protein [Flectobacillus longus]|uniref:hypothetical protein n=1 Tax=Flectobacillus longus TaxID=2984207 RepID=UPI0024B852EF|nr:hypothetical protein [Flectobacillus longus]MDI9878558.1 hypothetical protein [Flectobacillus longus]
MDEELINYVYKRLSESFDSYDPLKESMFNNFKQNFEKILSSDIQIEKQKKLMMIRLLDEFNLRLEILNSLKNNQSEDDLTQIAERLGNKFMSSVIDE